MFFELIAVVGIFYATCQAAFTRYWTKDVCSYYMESFLSIAIFRPYLKDFPEIGVYWIIPNDFFDHCLKT